MARQHRITEADAARLLNPETHRSDISDELAGLDPLGETDNILVTLDQLRPYDRNPRKSRNPAYEEIKASIRNTGLKQKPRVTRRSPDDDVFMIFDGGNTRLEILWELYRETGEERFYRIKVDFIPWQGEIAALAGHMSENENRGNTLFIEKALAAAELRKLFEEEDGSLTGRALARLITESGWSLNHANLTRYEYVTANLLPYLDKALWEEGAGHPLIVGIRKIETAYQKYWIHYDADPSDFKRIWTEVLEKHDPEYADYGITDFLNRLRKSLELKFGEELGHNYHNVAVLCDTLISDKNANLSDLDNPKTAHPGNTINSTIDTQATIDPQKTQNNSGLPEPQSSNQADSSKRKNSKTEITVPVPELQQRCYELALNMATKCGIDSIVKQVDHYFGFTVNHPARLLQADHPESGLFLRLYRLNYVAYSISGEFSADDRQIIGDIEKCFESKDALITAEFTWTGSVITPYLEVSKYRPDLLALKKDMHQLEDFCAELVEALTKG